MAIWSSMGRERAASGPEAGERAGSIIFNLPKPEWRCEEEVTEDHKLSAGCGREPICFLESASELAWCGKGSMERIRNYHLV